MQALIEFIKAFGLALWPLVIVQFNEVGLRLRLGRVRDEIGPGCYWRWWFIEEIHKLPSSEGFIDLSFGDVPTKDGKQITFSANVGYRILSPEKLWRNVHDPDDNLSRLALGALAALVARKNWGELASGQPKIRAWLKDRLAKETEGRGIEITRVLLTNLVEARPIRLLHESGSATVVADDDGN